MEPIRLIAAGLALTLALPAHAVVRAVPKVSVRPALTGASGAAGRVALSPSLGAGALKPAAMPTPVLSAASILAPSVRVPAAAGALPAAPRASDQAPRPEAQAEFRTPAAPAAPAESAKRDLQEPEPMTGAQMLAGFLVWLALVGLVALEYGLIYWAITQAPSSYAPTPGGEYMIPPGIDPWDIFR